MHLRYGLLLAAQLAWAAGEAYGFSAGFNYTLPDPNGTVIAIAVNAAGNTYLTGSTTSSTFPTTAGVFQPKYGGGNCNFAIFFGFFKGACSDAFVVKLDATGAVVWASYLGGIFNDVGTAIAVDASGNVYVAGTTSPAQEETGTNNFPTTAGSAFPSPPATTSSGNGGGFSVKISADGSQMIYGTYLPGLGALYGVVALAVDSSGNAYVASAAQPVQSPVPTTAGAFQPSSNANVTGAMVKLNAAGSALVYATYLGGTAAQDSTFTAAIAVDASGNAYIAGYLQGTTAEDFPVTPGAYRTVSSGAPAFVAKLSASGSGLVYSTFLGGENGEASAIKVDAQGRAYVLGSSTGFPTTPGAFEPSNTPPPAWAGNPVPTFLASLSTDGSSLVYGTQITGAFALDVDAAGDAYVAGNARSGFPVSAGALQQCFDDNPYAAEFSPQGVLLGASYFGQLYTDVFPLLNGGVPLDMNGPVAVGPNGMVSIGTSGNSFDGLQGAFVYNFLIDNPQQQDGPCMSPIVQNAANYDYGTIIAPGELIALKGAGIGPQTGMSSSPGANGLLPNELAGVQVFFDEFAAPLMYVQSGQINVAAPWELAGRASTQVRVVYNGVPMNSFGLEVQQAMPGLFYLSYPSFQAAILNADGSINSASNPAKAGDVISLFGTGGGPTSSAGVTGGFWGAGTNTLLTLPVIVQIAGVSAPVIYAGAAPGLLSAFFQINVQVPPGLPANPSAYISVSLGPFGMPMYETLSQASVAVE